MEMKIKKGVLQVVKHLVLTCCLLSVFPIFAQDKLRPTNNKGGYTMDFLKRDNITISDSVVIFGTIYNIAEKSKVRDASVNFVCKKIRAKEGDYSLRINSNNLGTNYLNVVALGYKSVETEFFEIKKRDSIKIDFYLEEDNRPLINCQER